jgi:hypothetical protein
MEIADLSRLLGLMKLLLYSDMTRACFYSMSPVVSVDILYLLEVQKLCFQDRGLLNRKSEFPRVESSVNAPSKRAEYS